MATPVGSVRVITKPLAEANHRGWQLPHPWGAGIPCSHRSARGKLVGKDRIHQRQFAPGIRDIQRRAVGSAGVPHQAVDKRVIVADRLRLRAEVDVVARRVILCHNHLEAARHDNDQGSPHRCLACRRRPCRRIQGREELHGRNREFVKPFGSFTEGARGLAVGGKGRASLALGQEQTVRARAATIPPAAANTIARKRMRAGGFREDCGTRLPPQDAATGDLPNPRLCGASLESEKAMDGFFHGQLDSGIFAESRHATTPQSHISCRLKGRAPVHGGPCRRGGVARRQDQP